MPCSSRTMAINATSLSPIGICLCDLGKFSSMFFSSGITNTKVTSLGSTYSWPGGGRGGLFHDLYFRNMHTSDINPNVTYIYLRGTSEVLLYNQQIWSYICWCQKTGIPFVPCDLKKVPSRYCSSRKITVTASSPSPINIHAKGSRESPLCIPTTLSPQLLVTQTPTSPFLIPQELRNVPSCPVAPMLCFLVQHIQTSFMFIFIKTKDFTQKRCFGAYLQPKPKHLPNGNPESHLNGKTKSFPIKVTSEYWKSWLLH